MSDPDDQDKKTPRPEPARQLFGQKGGGKPWEPGEFGASPPASAPPSDRAHEPAKGLVSKPYPRDAQYAPRLDEAAGEADTSSSIFSDVDDDGELQKLHPNYKLLMRLAALFLGVVVLFVGVALDGVLQAEGVPVPFGVVSVPALLIALFIFIRIPAARYNARGYQISRDRLRVVRGILWHSDTIVPFGRVQHIDVDQGPIERALGIATMTLHTAGSHNASVSLPGLGHELAVEMREEIRAHIKRESL